MPTPDEFWNNFQTWQRDLEGRFFKTQGQAGLAQANAVVATSLTNSDMIAALPYKERKNVLENFRTSILGLNTGYMDSAFGEVGPGGGGKIVGRYSGTGDDPLSYLLRRMSIQKDPTADAASMYSVSGNIPRAEYAKASMGRGKPNIREGARITVFDTETMGLQTDAVMVREISSIEMKQKGGKLSLTPNSLKTRHMKVGRGAFGSIYQNGAMMRMDDFISNLAGGAAMGDPGDGSAFLKTAIPYMQRLANSDYIAGHNVGFDISQVVGNAMKTSNYLNGVPMNGVDVRALVNKVLPKLQDGSVIDTMELATEYFGNQLDLAPEFKAFKSPRSFSLENIMMQTNMVELLKNDPELGQEFLGRMASQGQHAADIDTTLTAKLIQYTQDNSLERGVLGASGDKMEQVLRRRILTSYAPTPVSNIADMSHISFTNFERLYNEAIGQTDDKSLRVVSMMTDQDIDLNQHTAAEWYGKLTDGPDMDANLIGHAKFTPMEQHILESRQVLDSSGPVKSVINNLGQWNRFAGVHETGGGILNAAHTLFKKADIPDDNAFAKFQARMAKAGMPFAGLSLEERILTGAISTAADKKSTIHRALQGTAEGRLAGVGDDLGISRFSARTAFKTDSSVATIPLDVIRRAEADQIIDTTFNGGDRPQMLSLSTVDSTRSVNLNLGLRQDQASRLVSWLERSMAPDAEDADLRRALRSQGLNGSSIADMRGALESGELVKTGINIGHLDDAAGEQAYVAMNNVLQNLTRDTDKIPFRVGFMNMTQNAEDASKGIIRTGAVVLDRFLSDADSAGYLADMGLADVRASAAMMELPSRGAGLKAQLGYATGGLNELDHIADTIYGGIRKHGPRIAGAAALVFGGYYAYKKHKEQESYDASLQSSGYESDGDYQRYRQEMQMAPAPATRAPDPLLYAGVTGNLDRAAIGHTQMGSKKHLGLFAGV